MYLFMGAIGALRNPVGHREDLHEDPAEAASIVIFADLDVGLLHAAAASDTADQAVVVVRAAPYTLPSPFADWATSHDGALRVRRCAIS